MRQEHRSLPFECRGCLHVWEEDYLVRLVDARDGTETEIWLRGGVPVPPPSANVVCPRCGCQQAAMFPSGYLARHPELIPAEPRVPDETPLLSPVPARNHWLLT
ncbi:hypothetical protein ACTMTF_14535 [Nonomuraea sp. ZG12]|jgi:hypothetical protein|uniref:hypothetical protein n=1 Tax=Nonomuraea sp. ZG12 TaxID=3452207 RepID=UPI003F89A4BD